MDVESVETSGEERKSRSRVLPVFLLAVLLFVCFFWFSVIGYVDGPIIGEGDTAQYAFTGFYFSKNISWLPFPHLNLESNWTHYPYGANHVFLHWAFERDMLFAFLNGVFGTGPWFQLYFLFSMILTTVGSFFILRTAWEEKLAATAAIVIGFCNFYAIRKFPAHMPHSIVHWTVLGIVLDGVLMRKAVLREKISPHLIIARFALLSLSFGLELGYIAGFSLLSFSLCILALAVLLISRHRNSSEGLRKTVGAFFSEQKHQARATPRSLGALLVIALAAMWLYLPLSAQIALEAGSVDNPHPHYRRFENPLRIFLPFLPSFNPEMADRGILGDHGENWGFHFSPGLSFTLFALFGLYCGRSRWRTFAPTLVVLLLCLFFYPAKFPTLHLFPWFHFARVPGRATAVFPALLVLLGLAAWPLERHPRLKSLGAAALILLLVTESTVARQLMSKDRMSPSTRRLFTPDDGFWDLMRSIREARGEAVFEWPFALSSGRQLGIFNRRLKGINQLAQFHHKKVISVHFGRPVEGNLLPFVNAGWPHLFFPIGNAKGEGLRGFSSPRQRRDFVGPEWDFISNFFELNDFCGILLFPDLLPEETVETFHSRFGEARASSLLSPGPGRVEFIPKASEMRSELDPAAGAALHLIRPVFPLPLSKRLQFNEFAIDDLLGAGWDRPRPGERDSNSGRAELVFSLAHPETLRLMVRASTWGEQRVLFFLNGEEIGSVDFDGRGTQEFRLRLPAEKQKEENTLSLSFPEAREVEGRNGKLRKGIRVSWMRFDRVAADG